MGTTKKLKTTTYDLPAYWASALINDDKTGLDDWDTEKLYDFQVNNPNLRCVDCSSESFFSTYRGMGCDMFTYTFVY